MAIETVSGVHLGAKAPIVIDHTSTGIAVGCIPIYLKGCSSVCLRSTESVVETILRRRFSKQWLNVQVHVRTVLPVRERIGHEAESALPLRRKRIRLQRMNGCMTQALGGKATIES